VPETDLLRSAPRSRQREGEEAINTAVFPTRLIDLLTRTRRLGRRQFVALSIIDVCAHGIRLRIDIDRQRWRRYSRRRLQATQGTATTVTPTHPAAEAIRTDDRHVELQSAHMVRLKNTAVQHRPAAAPVPDLMGQLDTERSARQPAFT